MPFKKATTNNSSRKIKIKIQPQIHRPLLDAEGFPGRVERFRLEGAGSTYKCAQVEVGLGLLVSLFQVGETDMVG